MRCHCVPTLSRGDLKKPWLRSGAKWNSSGGRFPFSEPLQCFGLTAAAHLATWLQASADDRAQMAAEEGAAIGIRQLNAAYPGRFAVRHAGD